MRKDVLIVDGYNVIFAWEDLKKLSQESLEHARLELRHRLLNYGKYKEYIVILVFDGNMHQGDAEVERITKDFTEVFTSIHETADAFIEKEVFSRKKTFRNIYVCTSDGDEQHQILGFGGLRISARELAESIAIAKDEERKHYTNRHSGDVTQLQRNELGSLLHEDVAEKLERLRRGMK